MTNEEAVQAVAVAYRDWRNSKVGLPYGGTMPGVNDQDVSVEAFLLEIAETAPVSLVVYLRGRKGDTGR